MSQPLKCAYRLVFPKRQATLATKPTNTTTLATVHAPKGGIKIKGKFFPGGQFIEEQYVQHATPAQRAQFEHRRDMFDPDDWTPPNRQTNIFEEVPADAAPIAPVQPEPDAKVFPVAAKERAKKQLDEAWAGHDLTLESEARVEAAHDAIRQAHTTELVPAVEQWKAAGTRASRVAVVKRFAAEHGLDESTSAAIIEDHANGKAVALPAMAKPEPEHQSKTPSQTLAEVDKQQRERDVALKAKADTLPDGTQIDGWKKATIAGDVFWQKGNKNVTFIHKEVGQKKLEDALEPKPEPAKPDSDLSDLRKRLAWLDEKNYAHVQAAVDAASTDMSVNAFRVWARNLTGLKFTTESRAQILKQIKSHMEALARTHSQVQGIGNAPMAKPEHLKTGEKPSKITEVGDYNPDLSDAEKKAKASAKDIKTLDDAEKAIAAHFAANRPSDELFDMIGEFPRDVKSELEKKHGLSWGINDESADTSKLAKALAEPKATTSEPLYGLSKHPRDMTDGELDAIHRANVKKSNAGEMKTSQDRDQSNLVQAEWHKRYEVRREVQKKERKAERGKDRENYLAQLKELEAKGTLKDGRQVPKPGDKVTMVMPGAFGMPTIVHGEVRRATDGGLKIDVTGGRDSIGLGVVHGKGIDWTPEWTVVGDPAIAAKKQREKEEEEISKARMEKNAAEERVRVQESMDRAVASGHLQYSPEAATVGRILVRHHEDGTTSEQLIVESGKNGPLVTDFGDPEAPVTIGKPDAYTIAPETPENTRKAVKGLRNAAEYARGNEAASKKEGWDDHAARHAQKAANLDQIADRLDKSPTPSADRHDAIHAELDKIYRDPKFAAGDRDTVNRAVELEREKQIHKPAAIERAQKEIDAEKAANDLPVDVRVSSIAWNGPGIQPYKYKGYASTNEGGRMSVEAGGDTRADAEQKAKAELARKLKERDQQKPTKQDITEDEADNAGNDRRDAGSPQEKYTQSGRAEVWRYAGISEREADRRSRMRWPYLSPAEQQRFIEAAKQYDEDQAKNAPKESKEEQYKPSVTGTITTDDGTRIRYSVAPDGKGGFQSRREALAPGDASFEPLDHSAFKSLDEAEAHNQKWHDTDKDKPTNVGPKNSAKPDIALADTFAEMFDAGEKIDSKEIWKIADEHHGGTRAQGTYGPSDAYDSMEAGFNKYLMGKTNPTADLADAQKQSEEIAEKINQLPTQTNRSGEKDTHQQFSTPPHYAFAAAWLANLSPSDTVLEPSAGTGCLAVQAANTGADVYANEYSDRRADFLRDLLGEGNVHVEDAEQISAILPKRGVPAPSVVLMNPPFSQTAGRMGDKKDTMTGARHIEEAMRMLAPGGRLVSIVGRGMATDSPTFLEWFKDMQGKYNLRANIEVSGDEYTKYGTKFGTRMLVFDKTGPQNGSTVKGEAESIQDLMAKLEGVRNDRSKPQADQRTSGEQAGGGPTQKGGATSPAGKPGAATANELVAPDDRVQGGMGAKATGGRTPANGPGVGSGNAAGQPGGVSGRPEGQSEPAGQGAEGTSGSAPPVPKGRKKSGNGRKPAGGEPTKQSAIPGRELRPSQPLKYNERSEAKAERITESGAPEGDNPGAEQDAQSHLSEALFEQYKPARIEVPGAHKHPTALVESAAMSSVPPPRATYQPHLSPDVIEKGLLSEAALESVIYAGQAHESTLPAAEGEPEVRRGYFIGDGTGSGKGRQIAGILTDNFNQGRKKAVWLTEKKTLLEDARRDWKDVGNDPDAVFPFESIQKGKAPEHGIGLITYDTLKGKPKDPAQPSNLKKLAEWLGPDFDGVIAFDEAHNLANAISTEGGRGKKAPSQKALAGIDLQRMFPKARIVYVSATGATNVSNLAYAERLGLWGRGTPFAKKEQFIDEMERGGVAAMECVAQNLKAMGGYTARSLSFDDGTPKGKVTYDRLTHEMTPEQKGDYDAMATGWQHVLHNIDAALNITGGKQDSKAKSAAASQFWGAQQRFFNQVMTSMQTPSVIRDIEKQVAEGKSPVIQLTNTMEASTKRAEAKKEEDQDFEELDVSPKEILMQYLEKSFPVHRYETYVDEDGNERSRPVTDSNGDPVVDPEAVKIRDGLMDRLGALRVPDSPLDMIVHHFGHDQVAEVTGRTRRFVYLPDENGNLKKQPEARNAHNANSAETEAFQSGRKKILVFSQAGGTGRSYHADKNAPNNAQRIHYLLQPGWRADAAVQGLGRTHRTNQESAPLYRLVEIDALKAQKRFVSTIARRLDQLGALTRGQRQAGSTGIFKAADNLESSEARQALDGFFNDLSAGRIEGLSYNDVLTQMGFKKDDDKPGKKFDTPPMTQFLNRLLSLNVDTQAKVFDAYEERLQSRIEQAMRDGTLDVGVENYPADKIVKTGENVVHRDPKTGAEAKHVVMRAIRKAEKTPFDTTTKGKQPLHYVRNVRSGRIYATYPTKSKTDARTGQIIDQVKLIGPTGSGTKPVHELDFDDYEPKYEKLDTPMASKLWDEEYTSAPDSHESTEHFIMGAFLPVWDRIPGDKPKIYRMRTDDGQTIVGRHIPTAMVEQTLKNLNVRHEKDKIVPAEIHKRLSAGHSEAKLSNGWKLKSAMVGGERRIELTGPSYYEIGELERDGIIKERIRYDTRYFIPTGEKGAKVLERITEHRPIVEETGKTTTLATRLASFPRPIYRLTINGKPLVTLSTKPAVQPTPEPRRLAYRLTFGKR